LRSIQAGMPNQTPDKLQTMKIEAMHRISGIKGSPGGEFSRLSDATAEKITYQLEKLRKYAESALRSRLDNAERHLSRVCDLLAPGGRAQAAEFAGIQIPLFHSGAGLGRLYEKLNLFSSEHQLIWMD
jgi:hypothetical protein